MHVITAKNVTEALTLGTMLLREQGVQVAPRGSETLEYPTPVTTVYRNPRERVLFCPERDANPFFHLMESLWIIAGRRDVSWLAKYNSRIKEFSDNGNWFHGAYGYRMRKEDHIDQVAKAIGLLQQDQSTRRAVILIWRPHDIGYNSVDIPCNDCVFLKVREGKLNITVANRSNDMIWGAYGANVVQFSMLQEYIAAHLGLRVGTYRQVSDSFHVYIGKDHPGSKIWEKIQLVRHRPDHYEDGRVWPFTLVQDPTTWDHELEVFMAREGAAVHYDEPFFKEVAAPVARSWSLYKEGRRQDAITATASIGASDWRLACYQWLLRRKG